MDDRLKERLTGAVLLVAIVVLLVPAMFGGRSPSDSTAALTEGSAQSGSSAPTYTLAAPPVPTEPPVSPPVPTATPVPAPAPAAAAPQPPAAAPAPSAPAASAPTPSTAPAVAAADVAGKGWVVQVGSFTIRENADRMVRQGARSGMKLVVAGPDEKGYFRVRSTVQRDRAAALKLQARYRALGYKSLINSAP